MKKIEAIIKPFKLDDVKQSLSALEATGLTVAEVSGCGLQGDDHDVFRVTSDTSPKVKLEIIIEDEKAVLVAEAIERAARTGRSGDGTITIMPVDDVVRIRTGERGTSAV